MSEKITVIDYNKIGTKGYPYNWKELGIEPPMKIIDKPDRQISETTEDTLEPRD